MKDMPEAHRNEIERMRKEGVKNKSIGGRVGNIARWSQERAEGFAGAADNTFQRAASQGIIKGISSTASVIGKGISKKWGVNFDERIQHKTEEKKSVEKSSDVSLKIDSDTKKSLNSIDSGIQQIAKSVKSIDDLMIENALDRLEREKEATQDLKEIGVTRTKLEPEKMAEGLSSVTDKLFGMIDAIDDVMDIMKVFKNGGFGGGPGDIGIPDGKGPSKPGRTPKGKGGFLKRGLERVKPLAGRGLALATRAAPAAAVAASGYAGWKAGQWLNENTGIQSSIATGIEKTQEGYRSAVDMTSRGIESGVNAVKGGYQSAVDFTSRGIESGVNAYNSAVDMTSRGIESGVNAVKGGYQSAVATTSNVIEAGAKAWDATKENFGASESIAQVIKQAADRVGVDYGTLMAFAKQESGFNPNAKAKTSSATGLFQFINSTWNEMVRKYGKQYGIGAGDIKDPLANATMGALFVKENSDFLAKKGIPVNGTSLYAAHFLGPGGAAKLFGADPDQDAATLMPEAARANRAIFFDKSGRPKTVSAVIQTLFNKVGKNVDSFSEAAKGAGGNFGGGGASGNFSPSKSQTNSQAAGAAKMSTNTTAASVKTGSTTVTTSGGGGSSIPTPPSQGSAKSSTPGATPGPTRNNSPLKSIQVIEMANRYI
jgi:hypothetical protein